MADWKAYVRDRLPSLPLGPAREAEIVEELAAQLEGLPDGQLHPDRTSRGYRSSDGPARRMNWRVGTNFGAQAAPPAQPRGPLGNQLGTRGCAIMPTVTLRSTRGCRWFALAGAFRR